MPRAPDGFEGDLRWPSRSWTTGASGSRRCLSDEDVRELKIGDVVLVRGTVYAARDAAHKRMVEMLDRGEELPFDIAGQIVYYVGPRRSVPGT